MLTKDWILLLVPILFNGVFIFMLQKIFEKKQLIKTIKYEYASVLRQKIDISLKLHAKATRLANECESENDGIINDTIKEYVDSVLDGYYYYVQNKNIFKPLNETFDQIATNILELTKCSHQKNIDLEQFSLLFNRIRDELMILKDKCIHLDF